MTQSALQTLSDLTEDAHTRLKEAEPNINPVVGYRRGMRDAGIPADALNIDCLQSRRRILLILHDEQPDVLIYQFTDLDQEAGDAFEQMALSELSAETLIGWMREYFKLAG